MQDILTPIADYRVLSLRQLAVALDRKPDTVRKHVQSLKQDGFLTEQAAPPGAGRGRPVLFYGVTARACAWLKERGVITSHIDDENIMAREYHLKGHHQLQNSFRLHLVHAGRHTAKPLRVDCMASASPVHATQMQIASLSRRAGRQTFRPDLVVRWQHTPRKKNLLYFVEVDCGTESLVQPNSTEGNALATKVIHYLYYWREKGYTCYEPVWNCRFHGFRLLFLVHHVSRLTGISHLLRQLPPQADFIWLTDPRPLLDQGVSGAIWYPRGCREKPPVSMLDRLAFACPSAELRQEAGLFL